MSTYTLTEARAKLGDIVDNAAAHHRSVITHHGHPAAVVISFGDWEDIEDTMAILSNRAARAEGVQPIPWEEARTQLMETMETTESE